jgi:hypothetical protein
MDIVHGAVDLAGEIETTTRSVIYDGAYCYVIVCAKDLLAPRTGEVQYQCPGGLT